jgi:SAM-dependent methyltransferase
VRRLDDTGAQEFWRMVKRHALALLDLREGAHLLDVGCGTGDDVRSLARIVGTTGRVVGVDASATMITEARKRDEGLHLSVAFYQGDAHRLDFPDRTFDGCRAERVLQHLVDPCLAVAEMVRVARPGAPIVIAEPDYGALRIDGADRAVTDRILEHRRDHFLSGTIGRQLPRICKDCRLSGITIRLFGMAGADVTREEERLVLRKYAADAQAAGAISGTEAATWLADLVDAGTKGRYRRTITIFLASGRKS